MATIRKYNKYCEQLENLYDPVYTIPLPTPLPTKLAELWNDQTLCQDVWISPSVDNIPRWTTINHSPIQHLDIWQDNSEKPTNHHLEVPTLYSSFCFILYA